MKKNMQTHSCHALAAFGTDELRHEHFSDTPAHDTKVTQQLGGILLESAWPCTSNMSERLLSSPPKSCSEFWQGHTSTGSFRRIDSDSAEIMQSTLSNLQSKFKLSSPKPSAYQLSEGTWSRDSGGGHTRSSDSGGHTSATWSRDRGGHTGQNLDFSVKCCHGTGIVSGSTPASTKHAAHVLTGSTPASTKYAAAAHVLTEHVLQSYTPTLMVPDTCPTLMTPDTWQFSWLPKHEQWLQATLSLRKSSC